MVDDFTYDVFRHSAMAKAVVRDVAERLRGTRDGVQVWFDEWEIRSGHSIPAKLRKVSLDRSASMSFDRMKACG